MMKKLATIFTAFMLTWQTVNCQYYPYNNPPIAQPFQPFQPYQPYPPYPPYPNPQSYPYNPYNPYNPNPTNYPIIPPNTYPTNPNFQVYPNNGYCAPLSPPANGFLTSFCGNTYGSSCTFACSAGYTLSGQATVTCLGNNWSATRPTCAASSTSNIIGYWAVPNRG